MKKLLDWLTAVDEHGDSPITFLVFAVTVISTLYILASMPGY